MTNRRPSSWRRIMGSVALTGALVAPALTVAAPAAADAPEPVRILPLGDSITSGVVGAESEGGQDGYRRFLLEELAAERCAATLVGSRAGTYELGSGSSRFHIDDTFQDVHQAYPGDGTRDILNVLPEAVAGLDFDVVLLHAGTNDYFTDSPTGGDPAGSVDHLGEMIDILRERNPNVTVLVAKPIKAGPYQTGVDWLHFNPAGIDEMAVLVDGLAAKSTAQSPVIPVDLNTGFQLDWLPDHLHPNAAGRQWMAERWMAALEPFADCAGSTGPVIADLADLTTVEGRTALVQVEASAGPDRTLAYAAAGLPAGLEIDGTTGQITGVPTTVGSSSVTVTVTDDGSPALSDTATFTWTVTAAPLPEVTTPGPQTSTLGRAITPLPVEALYEGSAAGLTFSASGLPAGLTIDPATGVISGTPTDAGESEVAVIVRGGVPEREATVTFPWTISEAPVPVVTNPGPQTSTQDRAIPPLPVVATYDGAEAELTFSASGLPAGLTIDPATGVISGTPTTAGQGAVTVTATGGDPVRSGHATFTWTVEAVTMPVIPGVEPGAPVGHLDRAVRPAGNGPVTMQGWAFDSGTYEPGAVHVWVFGPNGQPLSSHAGVADRARPDVAAAFPGVGERRGFSMTVPAPAQATSACAFAISDGGNQNRLLGCLVLDGPPKGTIDVARGGLGQIRVEGWAFDPSTTDPGSVHVYIGGQGFPLQTGVARPDVAAAHRHGSNHGFAATLPATPGRHDVCAYAISARPGGPNPLIGCREVVVPGGDPFGALDVVEARGDDIRVAGWAIDPDTAASIPVHVYVGTVGHDIGLAGSARPDVGRAFEGYGPDHGFDQVVERRGTGPVTVCAYGINTTGAGNNAPLGCKVLPPR